MKFSVISVLSVLTAVACAAPAPLAVRVQLEDQLSGRNSNNPDNSIIADGTRYSIKTLYSGTGVDSQGSILATSVLLTGFPRYVECVIYRENSITFLSQDKSFADLDGNVSPPVPQNLNGAYIQCNGSV